MQKSILMATLIGLGACLGEAVVFGMQGNPAWILGIAGAVFFAYRALALTRRAHAIRERSNVEVSGLPQPKGD